MVINWDIAIYFWWLIPTPIRSFFQPSKMKPGHLMMNFFAVVFLLFLSDRKRGCIFPMVIWPAFRMGQYWANDHLYRAPQVRDRRSGNFFNFYRSCYRNSLLWPVWFDQSGLSLVSVWSWVTVVSMIRSLWTLFNPLTPLNDSLWFWILGDHVPN